MRIAFEVNGVLRDTIKKLESTYEKLLIDELEVGEGEDNDEFKYEIIKPINTEIIKDHFKFKSDEELYDFIYVENPMTIFGHAPSTEMNTFVSLDKIYKELRDENEIIIVSDEFGKSKPSTLFFLSKVIRTWKGISGTFWLDRPERRTGTRRRRVPESVGY